MLSKISKMKNKKGFSLIELIVVIAIIGILVMLAAPKFMGYTERAKVKRIQNDVKVVEGKVMEEYIASDYQFDGNVPNADLEAMIGDKAIYGTEGKIDKGGIKEGNYKEVGNNLIKEARTKLKGKFYANADGKVYYVDDKANSGDKEKDTPPLTDDEINNLIKEGFIPVASADELQQINDTSDNMKTWGAGTDFEMTHIGGLGEKYIQVKDIDLSNYDNWIPIGINPEVPFKGVYDGGNHTVSNFKITDTNEYDELGLFGDVEGSLVTIQNLNIDNVLLNNNAAYNTGVLIGGNSISSQEHLVTVSNVRITNANVSASSYAGGIIGFNLGTFNIDNIYFEGTLNGSYVGGVVGASHNGKTETFNITNSKIKGNFLATDSAGGFIGETSNPINKITDSYYDGNLEARVVGGAIAAFYGNESSPLDLFNLNIKGNFKGVDAAGGLIGKNPGGCIKEIAKVSYRGTLEARDVGGLVGNNSIKTTINKIADINTLGDFTGIDSAGGLFGRNTTGINDIDNVSHKGNLSGNYVGGMTGQQSGSILNSIKNINTEGSFTGIDSAGGLIGENSAKIENIDSVSHKGNLFGNYVGGVMGRQNADINFIKNIDTVGDFTGIDSAGGLFGKNTTGINDIDNVSHKGNLSGNYVGGIIGLENSLSLNSIKNVNTEGNFTGIDSAGGLIGESVTNINNINNVSYKGIMKANNVGGLIGFDSSLVVTSIKNVEISNSEILGEDLSAGLFGFRVKDLTLENIKIEDNKISSEGNAGGLVSMMPDGDLKALQISILNTEILGKDSVGGLAGIQNGINELNDISISGVIEGEGTMDDGLGGSLGSGGLFGSFKGEISNSNNINILSNVSGINNTGKFIGVSNKNLDFSKFNFEGSISGTGLNNGGDIGLVNQN